VANLLAADRPAGGCLPEGRIVMTPQRPANYYPLSFCLIMASTYRQLKKKQKSEHETLKYYKQKTIDARDELDRSVNVKEIEIENAEFVTQVEELDCQVTSLQQQLNESRLENEILQGKFHD
jgi:hypothetical protein